MRGEYGRHIKRILRRAEALGWQVRTNRHFVLKSPEGETIGLALSPRNPNRTWVKVLKDLQRIGFPIEDL